jgi:hypothetical protein
MSARLFNFLNECWLIVFIPAAQIVVVLRLESYLGAWECGAPLQVTQGLQRLLLRGKRF